MAYEEDTKVVELQFNNKRFEANVAETMKTLDRLDEALKFEGAEKGFEAVNKAASSVDLSKLEKSVSAISERFGFFDKILDGVAYKLGGKVADLFGKGIDYATSLTGIRNMASGWDQYARKTSAVQTIMAATKNQFKEGVDQMAIVENELSKLIWFTDETSYKFLDMVDNIGLFTANGVRLDKAVSSMMGISTWAALSGAGVEKAGSAMHALSQAMGQGYVNLQRWRQLETVNMTTQEFRKTVLETAADLGTLKRVGNNTFQTLSGDMVDVNNIAMTLTEGKWLNNDVLTAALQRYGDFANVLHGVYEDLSNSGAIDTTSELLRMIDQYAEGTLNIENLAYRSGHTVSELSSIFDELTSDSMALGRSAFAAAQEAKTFEEAWDAAKEAVKSGWAETFELIFGNYEDAKRLWTNVSEYLYDIFNGGAVRRNEILGGWRDLGGFEKMEATLEHIANGIIGLMETVSGAWEEVFPREYVSGALYEFTSGLERLTRSLGLTEEGASGLHVVLVALFTPIRWILEGAGKISSMAATLIVFLKKVTDRVMTLFNQLSTGQQTAIKIASAITMIVTALALLNRFAPKPITTVGLLVTVLMNLHDICARYPMIGKMADAVHNFVRILSGLSAVALTRVVVTLQDTFGSIRQMFSSPEAFINGVKNVWSTIIGFFSNLDGYAPSIVNNLKAFFEGVFNQIANTSIGSGIITAFNWIGSNIVMGLVNGVVRGFVRVRTIAVAIFQTFLSKFMEVAGIHSPSLVMKVMGAFLVTGLIAGIVGLFNTVDETGQSLFDKFLAGFMKQLNANAPEAAKGFEVFINGFNGIREAAMPLLSVLLRIAGHIGDLLSNMSVGQIILLGLTGSVVALAVQMRWLVSNVNGVIKSATKLVESFGPEALRIPRAFARMLTTIGDSITSVATAIGTSIKRQATANAMLKYAGAIGILAVSLIALSQACQPSNIDNMQRAGIALGVLAAGFTAMSVMINLSAKGTGDVGFKMIAALIAGMAAIAVSLTGLIKTVDTVTDISRVAVAFATILGSIMAMAIALRYVTNEVGDKTVQTALILSFAGGISLIMLSLANLTKTINGASPEAMGFALLQSLAVIAAFGGLLALITRVDRSAKAFSGGIGVLAAAIAIRIIFGTLQDINKIAASAGDWQTNLQNVLTALPLLLEIGGVMIIIAGAMRIAGRAVLAAGIGLATGIFAIRKVIELIQTTDAETLEKGLEYFDHIAKAVMQHFKSVLVIVGIIDAVVTFLSRSSITKTRGGRIESVTGGNLKGVSQSIMALGIAMIGIAAGLKIIASIPTENLDGAVEALATMTTIYGLVLGLGGYFGKDGNKSIKALTGAIIVTAVALGLLSSFLATPEDYVRMRNAALAIGGTLVAFGVACSLASALVRRGDNVNYTPLIVMCVALGEVAAALFLLSNKPWEGMAATALSISAVLLAFGGAFKIMEEMLKNVKISAIAPMLVMCVALGEIGTALYYLSEKPWKGMLAAAGSMSATMLAFVGVIRIISTIGSSFSVATLIPVVTMMVVMAEIAGILYLLADRPWSGMIAAAGSLAIVMGSLALVVGILGSLGPVAAQALIGAVAVGLLSVELLAVSAALQGLAQYKFGAIMGALGGMLLAITSITVIAGVIGALAPVLPMVLIGLGVIALVIAAIAGFNAVIGSSITNLERFEPAVQSLVNGINNIGTIKMTGPKAVADTIATVTAQLVASIADMDRQGSLRMRTAGENVMTGFFNGIYANETKSHEAGIDMFEAFESGFKSAAGIHSPSRVMESLAGFTYGGFASGLNVNMSNMVQAGGIMWSNFENGFRDAAGIHSNSAVMELLAGFGIGGWNEGIIAGIPSVESAAGDVVNAFGGTFIDNFPQIQSIGSAFGGSWISGLWDKIKSGLGKIGKWISDTFGVDFASAALDVSGGSFVGDSTWENYDARYSYSKPVTEKQLESMKRERKDYLDKLAKANQENKDDQDVMSVYLNDILGDNNAVTSVLTGGGSGGSGGSGSKGAKTKVDPLVEALKALHSEYAAGKISLEQYSEAAKRLVTDSKAGATSVSELYAGLKDGSVSAEQFAEQLEKILKVERRTNPIAGTTAATLAELNKQYKAGSLNSKEFEDQIKKLVDDERGEAQITADLDKQLQDLYKSYQNADIELEEYIDSTADILALKRRLVPVEGSVESAIYKLHQQYAAGEISLSEYNIALEKIDDSEKEQTMTADQLWAAYARGQITIEEFREGIAKTDKQVGELSMTLGELQSYYEQNGSLPKVWADFFGEAADNVKKLSDNLMGANYLLYTQQDAVNMIAKAYSWWDDPLAQLQRIQDAYASETLVPPEWFAAQGETENRKAIATGIKMAGNLFYGFYKGLHENEDGGLLNDKGDPINSWLDMTKSNLEQFAKDWKSYLTDISELIRGSGNWWDGISEATTKGSREMLKNQEDVLAQQKTWVDSLKDLAARGLDRDTWLDLFNAGSGSIDKVLSLSNMSDRELQKFNENQQAIKDRASEYAEELAIIAQSVTQGYGTDVISALVKGATEAATDADYNAFVGTLWSQLSKEASKLLFTPESEREMAVQGSILGKYIDEGWANGIASWGDVVSAAARKLADDISKEYKDRLVSNFQQYGKETFTISGVTTQLGTGVAGTLYGQEALKSLGLGKTIDIAADTSKTEKESATAKLQKLVNRVNNFEVKQTNNISVREEKVVEKTKSKMVEGISNLQKLGLLKDITLS